MKLLFAKKISYSQFTANCYIKKVDLKIWCKKNVGRSRVSLVHTKSGEFRPCLTSLSMPTNKSDFPRHFISMGKKMYKTDSLKTQSMYMDS